MATGYSNTLGYHLPLTMTVNGPSDSGKTSFVLKLLRDRQHTLHGPNPLRQFFWCVPEDAAVPAAILDHRPPFRIIRGVPALELIPPHSLVVLDDLGGEAQTKEMRDLFTIHSHHKDISVILIQHNVFPKSPVARDIALSTKYTVFLKQPRSPASFLHFTTQSLGKGAAHKLYQCYLENNREPYAHVIADNTQRCPAALRYRANVSPAAPYAEIYATRRDLTSLIDTPGSQYGWFSDRE